ncbi:hypothetical protein, variant [Aphanomyces invadans]|uniref:PRELI/MSF1 domain-containing protein n=1 Tax=Aphanomyces invadans TaxID=157072 RepID=A0A024TZW0_9STRA|nr:hypothetical protein, variant [Aphanomyces invadans]XP_008872305.1 hypothetical protein H310_08371 [Aphanomyces invadans]ETV98876.1 hypothetical protein H310_08371 [Aphanomyces invadans]ETV98877.1 hypothetical protein, variant [Aphanomyces invadans]|eukprot:XP_008872304.1 hypothetical protein, variant [Aphanomyces invadans]
MGRVQRSEHVFAYPWEVVSAAFWRKYPHPMLPHVEKMEVISRFLDEQGCLHTARLGKCTPANVPSWVTRVLGTHYSYVYEESVCDPVDKTLRLQSANLSFRSLAVVDEICSYSAPPRLSSSAPTTLYTQTSRVRAFFPFVSRAFEEYWVERGTEAAHQGISAMEDLCSEQCHTPR